MTKYRIRKTKGLYYIEQAVEYIPYYSFPIGFLMLIISICDKSVYAKRIRWEYADCKLYTYTKLENAKMAIDELLKPDEIIEYPSTYESIAKEFNIPNKTLDTPFLKNL